MTKKILNHERLHLFDERMNMMKRINQTLERQLDFIKNRQNRRKKNLKIRKSKKIFIQEKHQNKVIYMVTSTDVTYEATKEGCRNYLNSTGPWATFKEYLSWNDSYKIIEINEQVWELSECFCQYWKKNCICKHVIGISYKLSKFDTFSALDLNIEQNSKRGRRKKASSALQRNSTGPFNRDAFNINMSAQLVSNSETNDSQPVINELSNQSAPTKRPRGRPRKNKN
ncbi:hypothetical protein BpHYR1_012753 [Brachionus plicatilis]|uniref:SWIM-type domain-containing protein n=1 Tax=Brachionus plicatilis TaxID=10195 RepID=A0A3M7STV5_BRAPC|nr:hypothetical protein BpHYR1_012753 [Brachionus plicatilis]